MSVKPKAKTDPPPLVNHRWHLPSVGEMLDRLLPQWDEGKYPDFSGPDGYQKLRTAFEHFADHLLSYLENDLERAAGRGIQQALRLIRDPEYHKTIRRRTKKQIQQWNDERERQDRWRERWKRCEFTPEERMQEIGRIAHGLQYHQTEIEKLTERKKQVESGTVILEEVEPQPEAFKSRVVKDGDDEWPDQISFD